MEKKTLFVSEVIGDSRCLSYTKAQTLYNTMVNSVGKGYAIRVSFKGIRIVSTTFLNIAFGQLFGKFDKNAFRKVIGFVDMQKGHATLLHKVLQNAEKFFWNNDLDVFDY